MEEKIYKILTVLYANKNGLLFRDLCNQLQSIIPYEEMTDVLNHLEIDADKLLSITKERVEDMNMFVGDKPHQYEAKKYSLNVNGKIKIENYWKEKIDTILTNEHQLYSKLCRRIGISRIEDFKKEVLDYESNIEFQDTKHGFGTPEFKIRKTRHIIPAVDNSQHQHFNLHNSHMGDAIMGRESTIMQAPVKEIKADKEKWWNKPLWVGVILLILSGLGWLAQQYFQRHNKEDKIEQASPVQEQKK